jgi:dynactin 1
LEALRGTVRFLRNENAYLKGQDLLKEIEALPPLREPTPPLDPSGASDTDESDSEYSPPTIRSLSTESKLLFRDVVKFSSAPKVVDLSAKRMENKNKPWIPRKMTPAYQILERKKEAGILSQRMKALLERTESLGL